MSTRPEKVGSVIQREISSLIAREQYEGLSGLITITKVEVTDDMGQARIYISAIGQEPESVLEVLKKNIYEMQGEINRKLEMKKIPRLSFVYDETGEAAAHLSKLIDEARGRNDDK